MIRIGVDRRDRIGHALHLERPAVSAIIERAVARATGPTLVVADLPEDLANPVPAATDGAAIKTLEALEREHILKALEHTGGNRALAAQLLGIDRVSLWRKLRRYNEEV